MTTENEEDSPRPLRKTVIAIVIAASLVLFLASFAVWADRQFLETDTWVETSGDLLADEDVKDALAGFLVDVLYENVDVEAQVQTALPSDLQGLAGPVAGGIRELANRAALEVLDQDVVLSLWETANRTAHGAMLTLVEGGTASASTEGGVVTLDLRPIVERVGARTGLDVAGKIPEDAAQIEVLRSDELSLVQEVVDLLQTLAWVLVVLGVALFALAIYLAKGWRREALRATAFAFIVVGIAVLVVRSVVGDALVGSLTTNSANEPAVSAVWSIATSQLSAAGGAMIFYGVVGVLGVWLAGTTSAAIELRRSVAPALQERLVSYVILVVIALLFFWWAPTEGTERLAPSVILLVLLFAGFEALRRQVVREFPGASWEESARRWRERFASLRRRDARRPRPGEDGDRLEQLERLGKLRDSGVLDPEELEREKRRLLGSE